MSNNPIIYAVMFEGIGLPFASTATDTRVRFASGGTAPAFDSDNLYRTAALTWLPAEVGFGVDYQTGDSNAGGFDFQLFSDSYVRARFLRDSPPLVAKLLTGVTATATAFVTDTTGLTGTVGVIGREAVAFSTESPAGTYTVIRGVNGTLAQAHGTSGVAITSADAVDNEIFDADRGGAMTVPGRRVTVVRARQNDTAYTDEIVLWEGVLSTITHPEPTVASFSCKYALDLARGEICWDLWQGDLDGDDLPAEDNPNKSYNYTQTGGVVPPLDSATNRVLYSWDGNAVFTDAGPTPNVQVGNDGGVEYLSGDVPHVDWTSAPPKRLNTCYSTDPAAPNLGATTAKLSSNLAVLTLQLLLTSERGDNYPGSVQYDLGHADPNNAHLGLDIPYDLVDTEAFEDMAARFGAGTDDGAGSLLYRPSLHFGVDGKSVKPWPILQAEWMSVGCVMHGGPGGKITITRLEDSLAGGETSVTDASLYDKTWSQDRRLSSAPDSVALEYRNIPGVGTRNDTFEDVFKRRRALRSDRRIVNMRAEGISDENTARDCMESWIAGYHIPIKRLSATLLGTIDVWPGDVVSVTSGHLLAADGTAGVTARPMLVVGRRYSFETATVRYVILDVGSIYNRTARWGPSARVNAGAGTDLTVLAGVFSSGSGPYSTDLNAIRAYFAAAPTATWDVLDGTDYTRVTSNLTISGISVGGTITFTGAHGASTGDYLVPADYDNQPAALTALTAFMADTSGSLGAANDAGHQWTR